MLKSYKKTPTRRVRVVLVELGGFEPPQAEPKSVVLPLHHSSMP